MTRQLLLALAGAALLAGSTIISYNLRNNNNNSLVKAQTPRLRRLVALAKFHDPRSEFVKRDDNFFFPAEVLSDGPPAKINSHHLEPESFSYGFSSDESNCIKPEEVMELGRTLRDLYERHGVRAFPRNGFLLGIVRHGGFLPNEDVPDADLGIMFEDVDRVRQSLTTDKPFLHVGQFILSIKPTEEDWVNWKGRDPVTQEEYPFFGVRIKRGAYSVRAQSVYSYGNGPDTFFYPRLNRADYNHRSHSIEMIRYNAEGANYRLLDTDELLNEANNEDGKQIGTVFKTDLGCMTLKQFYFTMIYVPCDYEYILETFYGRNWNHVESRAKGGKGSRPAVKLSDQADLIALKSGPKPLCA